MNFPMTITFHNTRRSVRMEEEIREHAERLDKFHSRIQNCEVIIDQPHHHHNKGNEYHVRILLSVPRTQLAINSSSSKNGEHTSLHVAIRDAFESAKRQLRQHRVKPREQRTRTQQTDPEAPDSGATLSA